MKNLKIMIVLLLIVSLLYGCGAKGAEQNPTDVQLPQTATIAPYETPEKEYYTLVDFQDIEINVSTYQDVRKIAVEKNKFVTANGIICEYAVENGGYIRISFFSNSLHVGKIIETPYSIAQMGYPIVLIDTTNHQDKAYIICFGENGTMKTLDEYTCDGMYLSSFVGQDDLLDRLQFTDMDLPLRLGAVSSNGESREIWPSAIECTERGIDETLLLNVKLTTPVPEGEKFYIGTYSGIDIFPAEITYQDDSVQVDLDGNGQMDHIEWSFSPTTTYYGVKSDYTISVNRNGERYPLVEETYIPLDREDLAVFVADINQDGEFEIVVYANGMSQFGHLTVYTFVDNQYSVMLDYAVDCEP